MVDNDKKHLSGKIQIGKLLLSLQRALEGSGIKVETFIAKCYERGNGSWLVWNAWKQIIKRTLKKTSTFHNLQSKALFRCLSVGDQGIKGRIDPVELHWSLSSHWLNYFEDENDYISNSFREQTVYLKTVLQRSKCLFEMYSSANKMSEVQWVAFVRDTRLCNNLLSYDLALIIFETLSSPSKAVKTSGEVSPPKRISEEDWFCACHAMLMVRLNNNSQVSESAYCGARAWKSETINLWDRNFTLPLCLILNPNSGQWVARPTWQDVWLFDPANFKSSLACSEELWAVYNVILYYKEGNMGEFENSNVKDTDMKISRRSLKHIFEKLSIIPRMVDLYTFEKLLDSLHAHSALADEKPSKLLFPEFLELCMAISAQCGSVGDANAFKDSLTRFMLFFSGEVSTTADSDDLCRQIHEATVAMKRERIVGAFTSPQLHN